MNSGMNGLVEAAHALRCTCLMALVVLLPSAYAATDGSEGSAWGSRLNDASQARGWETPGELLDLRDGSYGFEVTDLVVPGDAGLDVEVVRSFDKRRIVVGDDRLLGLWDLEIPRVVTMGLPGSGAVGTGSCSYARNPIQDHVLNSNWWAGATLVVPHEDAKPLLIYHKQGPLPASVDFVTTDNWTATCSGEAWIVRSPAGRTYRIDRAAIGSTGAVVYASRVSDLHGNWIEYDFSTYSDGYPQRTQQRLTAIRGSAGQHIAVETQKLTPGAPGSGPDDDYVISAISHAGRTWRYAYTFCADVGPGTPVEPCDREPLLATVIRPDTRTWLYRYHKRISYAVGPGGCCQRNFFFIYKATYPNGLVADYTVTEMPQEFFDAEPYNENVWSLAEKKVSGPGIPTYRWRFWYQVPGYQGGLNGTAWGTPIIQTYVAGPDRIHYSEIERGVHDAGVAFGERSENPANWVKGLPRTAAVLPYPAGVAAPTNAQIEQHVYDQRVACVFNRTAACRSEFVATAWQQLPMLGRLSSEVDSGNHDFHLRSPRVPVSRTVYRDTGTYARQYTSYTSLGFPQAITEKASGGPERKLSITWFHNATNWVTGLPEERAVLGEGTVYTRYDAKGLPYESGRFGLFVNFAWWSNGNLKNVSRYDSGRVIFTREFANYRFGTPQLETRPEGISISRVVADTGTVSSQRNARGYTTQFEYDALNRPTLTTPPAGYVVTESWNSDRIVTRTRGSRRQTLEYDVLGRLVRTEDRDLATGTAIVRVFEYDSAGRRTFESDPAYGSPSTHGVRYLYDALDRIVSATHTADGTATAWSYTDGHVVTRTDPRGFRTVTTLRAFADPGESEVMRVVEETVAGDASKDIVTVLTRNLLGQITSVTRGGYKKTIQYDAKKLPWRTYEPETGTTEFTFNRAGFPTSRKVGASPVTYYNYDDADRLEFVDYPGTTPDVSRIYDANGNVTHLYSGITTEVMTYDANDNLKSVKLTILGANVLTSLTYDGHDALASIKYPDGESVALQPDALGRPTRVGNYVTQVRHHATGGLERLLYGNGLDAWQQNDARNRPSRVYGGTAFEVAYQYDDAGNVTSVADRYNPTHDLTLKYDGANRIDYVWFPRYAAHYTWGGDFRYDSAGNLSYKSTPRGTLSYSYDSTTRRLLSTSGSRAYAFAYDVYGNVTRNGTGTGFGSFTYDDAGRLRSFNIQGVQGGGHDYDGAMRRVRTVLNGLTTYTFYLGNRLLFEHQAGRGILKQHYYAGDRVVATREKTGFNATSYAGGTSKITYLHTDPRGSVIAATDAARQTLWREAYDPFGGKIVKPAGGGNTLWYTGREFDQGSGLAYHGARYYDPFLGRFMSPDPVSWSGGRLEQFNRYAYGANNPFSYTDKDGEIPAFLIPVGIIAGKSALESVVFQHAEMALGLRESFSWGDLLTDVAIGVATGGTSSAQSGARSIGILHAVSAGRRSQSAASRSVQWSPINGPGPLSPRDAATFRSSTYLERVLDEPLVLHRVFSDPSKRIGAYWSSDAPRGPLQAVIDNAIDQNWQNAATDVVRIRVPAGTTIYEGAAAAQRGLVGGANQVFLPEVHPNWVIR